MNIKIPNNLLIVLIIIIFHTILLQVNYLLFHTFIELFAVVVAFSLFIITWNSRKYISNKYLLIVGISALFIGILDMFHIVTYKGMDIIKSPIYYANQFWIITRFIEASTMLCAFIFIKTKSEIKYNLLIFIYSVITLLVVLSILVFENFPTCYIEGEGQTTFKIYSEYAIMSLLGTALILLHRNKSYFGEEIYKLLAFSILSAILSEFSFTLYVSNYGLSNQVGHYTKLLTFFLIYKANIETGFIKPTESIFKELKESEKNYKVLYEKYKKQGEELLQRNFEYKELNSKLLQSNKTKDKFFSIIAHDLKNPFNGLLGLSNLLIENNERISEERKNTIIQAMHKTSKNAYELLENLLQWSRSQLDRIEFHPVTINVNKEISEIVYLFDSQRKKKNIKIKTYIDEQHSLYADRNMFQLCVRNLISNAVKFTPQGGNITISTKKSDNSLFVYVKDSGYGMPKAVQEKLFKITEKVSTVGTDKEVGTGLGLILVQEFMSKHNGEVFFDSEPGYSTTFTLRFPSHI